jgi:galactokinase/mevalonate kinase-like predicted kinase
MPLPDANSAATVDSIANGASTGLSGTGVAAGRKGGAGAGGFMMVGVVSE